MWKKNCPKCGEIQIYSCKKHLNKAIKLNRQCRKCMFNSQEYRDKHVFNTRNMWSNENKKKEIIKKRNTQQAKDKWRKSAIPSFNSKEYKEKQSILQKKLLELYPERIKDNSKRISDIWNDTSSVYHTEEFREKLSKTVKIAIHKPDIRKRHIKALAETKYLGKPVDKGQILLLEKWNRLGFNFQPNFQLHTDDFLAYIDGYDKEKSVVLEYDGQYHLRNYRIIKTEKVLEV